MSGNAKIDSAETTDRLLSALGEQLELAGQEFDVVVIGGSALLALGLVTRTTQDVDVVALATAEGLVEPVPLPAPLAEARDRVARDFGLPDDWLNSEAAPDMVRLGLPDGFLARCEVRTYGPALTVRFASRYDQIHFKLHAAVDRGGPGKHLSDLEALHPRPEEIAEAARWSRSHDPSEGYLSVLRVALDHFGVADADLGP